MLMAVIRRLVGAAYLVGGGGGVPGVVIYLIARSERDPSIIIASTVTPYSVAGEIDPSWKITLVGVRCVYPPHCQDMPPLTWQT